MKPALIRCKSDKSNNPCIFPNNTIINLHQIRVIHKNRVIRDLKCNVENYIVSNEQVDALNDLIEHKIVPYNINLRDYIEYNLSYLLSKKFFYKYVNLSQKNSELEIKTSQQEQDIDELNKKVKFLESELAILKKTFNNIIDKNSQSNII